MKLTEAALAAINNKKTRLKLAIAMDLTEGSVIRLIKKNSENLTKAAAMEVIKEETGLSEEEILTSEIISEINVNEG
ncbi:MAG: hypothetical protein IPJ81_18320 [Chitinophagaceae bacterium]|nr:hypothetical protein [Chitinophagaceae bacterium]